MSPTADNGNGDLDSVCLEPHNWWWIDLCWIYQGSCWIDQGYT